LLILGGSKDKPIACNKYAFFPKYEIDAIFAAKSGNWKNEEDR
jgi:hypothetical protein